MLVVLNEVEHRCNRMSLDARLVCCTFLLHGLVSACHEMGLCRILNWLSVLCIRPISIYRKLFLVKLHSRGMKKFLVRHQ